MRTLSKSDFDTLLNFIDLLRQDVESAKSCMNNRGEGYKQRAYLDRAKADLNAISTMLEESTDSRNGFRITDFAGPNVNVD
jgi:hypothetical protein